MQHLQAPVKLIAAFVGVFALVVGVASCADKYDSRNVGYVEETFSAFAAEVQVPTPAAPAIIEVSPLPPPKPLTSDDENVRVITITIHIIGEAEIDVSQISSPHPDL